MLVEPAIPTTALIRRPDLVLHKPSTVVADNAELQEAHLRKCHYDNNSDNQQWVTGKFPDADTVKFRLAKGDWGPVSIHSKGEWDPCQAAPH